MTTQAPLPAASPAAALALQPLTEAQEGLWYAQRLDPSNPVFNTGQYVDLRGTLDVAAFVQSVDQAMAEADGLSVALVDHPDGPRLGPASRPVGCRVVDLTTRTDGESAALSEMRRDMETPVDLERDPLAAQVLFLLAGDRALWYQRVHHVAIDGYGTGLLTRRVSGLYTARVTGVPEAGRPFAGHALVMDADAAYRASAEREQDRAFWMERFADRPDVAGLAEGVPLTSHTYRSCAAALPDEVGARLADQAASTGVSWPDVLVGLVAAYIQRHVGTPETIVGVPAMLRLGTPAARVPAMVMNILPVRIPGSRGEPLADYLRDVAGRLREARRHGRYRSEQLRRDLGLLTSQRRMYGVLINILPFDAAPALPGLSADVHTLGTGPVDDLTVTVRADATGRGLRIELDGNPRLYSEAALAAHAERLAVFLNAALGSRTLDDVPTVTEAERRHLIDEINDTAHLVPDVTLAALIESAMGRWPAAPALACGAEVLSYAQLDARTAHLARRLTRAGAGRGDIVAVLLPRSIDLEVALVGILRAGAAYLPIDPDFPPDRVRTILESARPRTVLTWSALEARVPAGVQRLLLDVQDDAVVDPATVPAKPELDDPAYVIYTSGSTGVPNGVVIQHRAIVNRLEWMRTHYGFTPDDRILQKTPATFDVSVWEFFLPLIAGATLVMAPPDAHKDPAWLARLIREHGVTTLHFVPSMLAQFLAEPAARGLRLRRVFCSGEALSAAVRDRFHETVDAELHNLYGPTEAAVDVTYWDASRHDRSSIVPIGWPVWNTRMYVLDERLRVVPAGATGHLFIAGVQLAREYLGRPDLTAERFVADPFGQPGSRMYRTGDLARWRADGAIEFLGRSDHQIKVRGIRIEPGEIEAALLAHEGVAQAAVVAREDRPGDQRLVAYVVPHHGRTPDIDGMAAAAAGRLPAYMVPSAFVVIDELPLGSSGKLDRRRLPAPAHDSVLPGVRPPRTPTEARIAALFGQVLGSGAEGPAIGAESDFFGLGGHSLLAAQLMLAIRGEWDLDLGLGVIFANPTVEALAAHVDQARGVAASPADGRQMDDGLGVVMRLSDGPGEGALFCMHPAGGLSWCYRALAQELRPRRRVYGIQARSLDVDQPAPETLAAMAADYVREVRRVQPGGPYHLLGWSVGGIVAQAMAVVLEGEGQVVGTLAMLDSYPSDRWRNEPEPDEGAALRALLLIAGLGNGPDTDVPLTRAQVMDTLRASGHALGSLSDRALSGVVRVVEHNSRLVRQHRHVLVAADVIHFRAALDHEDDGLSPQEWGEYTTGVIDVHDIPSLHAHMTGPAASRVVASVLNRRFAS